MNNQGNASLGGGVGQGMREVSADDIRRANNNREANQLQDLRAATLNYMYQKAIAEDWHAVADASMDLREIDAQIKVLTRS